MTTIQKINFAALKILTFLLRKLLALEKMILEKGKTWKESFLKILIKKIAAPFFRIKTHAMLLHD